MTLDEFRKDFLETVNAAAEARQDFLRGAFVDEAGERLEQAEEISDFLRCQHEGSGLRGRRIQVDGYALDETDGSMMLLIADWCGDAETGTLGQTDAKRLFGMLRGFVEEALAGRLTDGSIDEASPGYGLAADIRRLAESVTRFRLYLVSDRQLSSRVRDWPDEALHGVPSEFHIWDVARFHRAFESATGRDDLAIDFSRFHSDGLPCLHAGQGDTDYDAYLCVIPGDILADLYDHYGSRLLEGNIRSFLSTKGTVNKGIQATIRAEPRMFFAYNNGIAATAEAVHIETIGGERRLLHVKNLQIVNGGQTTASLSTARRREGVELSEVYVPMKLSVVPPSRSETLIPLIARYANSQNKVSDADFFANHAFHVRIEELSRRLWTPATGGRQHGTHWFYERARGQYLNEQSKLTKAKKKEFLLQNPRAQLFTKTDLAKFENSWNGYPHKVSLGAQKNFLHFAAMKSKAWGEDDNQFNEEYFHRVVALAILFRRIERLVTEQSWYDGGYRAQVVTYSLALFRHLLTDQALGMELDTRAIWDRQALPAEADVGLARLARAVHGELVQPATGVQNVTEWAKREACWSRIQSLSTPLPKEFEAMLVPRRQILARQRDAAVTQRIDSGIDAQMQVLQIPVDEWKNMRRWAESRGLVTPKESQILGIATMMPTRLPSDRQSALLLDLSQRIRDSGYRGSARRG